MSSLGGKVLSNAWFCPGYPVLGVVSESSWAGWASWWDVPAILLPATFGLGVGGPASWPHPWSVWGPLQRVVPRPAGGGLSTFRLEKLLQVILVHRED